MVNNLTENIRVRKENSKKRSELCEIDFKLLITEAENYFNVSRTGVISDSRKKIFVEPRFFCFHALRVLGHSFTHICKPFNRHHTSAIYGHQKMVDLKELSINGMCSPFEDNIITKVDEVIAKIWLENHERKTK